MTIATPEGVTIELTLAGIGSRSIAAIFDLTIQGLIVLAIAIVAGRSGWGAAVISIGSFLVIFGYDVCFEVLAGGRTPGKRFTGLRVVRTGGRPIDLVSSAIRNVLRLVDFLPAVYGLGMLVMLVTRRNQRLGDVTAGTLVVRERKGGRRPTPPTGVPEGLTREYTASGWDVSAVNPADVAVVREFLGRRHELAPAARERLAADLAARLRPRVAGAPAAMSAESFLETLVRIKAGS